MSARIQKLAPSFTATALYDKEFVEINLEDYRGRYLVLFFYPLDFTFVCPTELLAFNERVEDFQKLGCELVAVSVDSEYTHLAWSKVSPENGGIGQLDYPLVSDITKEISKEYGVLLEDDGVALRGLFIIDKQGVIRQITINDLPVGRNVEEVLRLIEAFQVVDEHGNVCPANWTMGDETIVPDPERAKEYFAKVNEPEVKPSPVDFSSLETGEEN